MSIYDVVVLMMKVGVGSRLTIRNLHKQNKTKMGGGRIPISFLKILIRAWGGATIRKTPIFKIIINILFFFR